MASTCSPGQGLHGVDHRFCEEYPLRWAHKLVLALESLI